MDYSYELKSLRKESDHDKYKRITFFILISLTVIQQMPLIKDLFYSQIRLALYVGFGLFSAISFLKINKYLRISFVRYFVFTIIYSVALFVLIRLLERNSPEVFELIIPFGILICSLNTYFDKKQLSRFLIWYVILSAILGISSIFYYGQGFTITKNYFLTGKNQIGPLIGISTIITGIWIINKKQFDLKHHSFVLRISIFFVLIISILIIRNRAGLLGISVVALLSLFKECKLKKNLKDILVVQFVLILAVILFLLGTFDGVFDLIFKSIFYNYNITDLNSISAGRTNVYKLALDFAIQHPILGELGTGRFINSTPHNYILNKWVKYGVVVSLPLVFFYLYLWFFIFKEIKTNGKKTNFTLPLWVLLFSLVVSVFEYTYPYGPGVSQLMAWFLLGQYFR